ncbi:MAG: hypothetical protein Q4G43_07700 [Mobilicoccus sp.]|nr:hypothetical protein [Mobilicoccus sp.]
MHTSRTLAVVAAFAVAATGTIAFAPAAQAAAPRDVVLRADAYPRLIDRPGTENDAIRIVNVPGVAWKVGSTDVTFPSGHSATDIKVTEATQVTAAAVDGDVQFSWRIAAGTPTAWNFPAPSIAEAPAVNIDAVVATWNDVPGTRDTVTIRKVEGVIWTVTTGTRTITYDAAAFGTRTELTLPAVAGTSATEDTAATPGTTVTVDLDEGYELPEGKALPTFTNSLTSAATVNLTAAVLDPTIELGENPDDRHKGFGRDAAVETVKVTGIPGVRYQVGNGRPVAVRGVAFLPVLASDLKAGEDKVTVKVLPNRGYTVPPDYAKELNFKDGEDVPKVAITDAMISTTDLGGTSRDVLTLTQKPSMVWWVGQPDAKGVVVYRAQRPGRDGKVTFRPRFARGADTAEVHIKPVANRGFVIDTSALTDDYKDLSFTFKADATNVAVANQGVVTGTKVAYAPAEGVASWATRYVVPPVGNRKATTRTLAVNPAHVGALGATSMTIDFGEGSNPTVTTRVARDYKLVTASAE